MQKDVCTAPEMIPTPKWSPNRPRNDPQFSSCRPRSDPQGIWEWWLNMGLGIAFSFFVEMLQSCHYFLFFRSFKWKKTVCRVTTSFQSRSSVVPVDLFSLMQCFEPRGFKFFFCALFYKVLFREMMISLLIKTQDFRRMQRWVSI